MENFGHVKDRRDFANMIGVPLRNLTNILYKQKVDNLYSSFKIPKKSGGEREIKSPSSELKDVQRSILKLIENHLENKAKKNRISHAFQKEKNIITNAKVHRNKKYVINLDLENFFESIHFGRVRGHFNKNEMFKFSLDIATIIAQLTCYKGKLPQGAPTSPIISNLICEILDFKILVLSKKYKLKYTRYADDLTFSTNDQNVITRFSNFIDELEKLIIKEGFQINSKKTRVQYYNYRQTVTGLIVNKKINIPREYYKNTRAMAYQLYKTGEFYIDEKKGGISELEGRFSFIDQLNKFNNSIEEGNHSRHRLNSQELQYQRFLFYKYFFANPKPLIVTEGKTDVRYIKAALKKHYSEYPNLIEKDSNGNFNFKIMFINRSKRLKYFFGMSPDGASALNEIYKLYIGSGYVKHYEYISKISGRTPVNPVILLFDNELISKGKPLKAFVNLAKLQGQEEQIKYESTLKLTKNLHLLTIPLIGEKQECDIEDLFDSQALSIEIQGRKFDKTDQKDSKLFYGKDKFSTYILSNYQNIDFSKFEILLNKMSDIVDTYN